MQGIYTLDNFKKLTLSIKKPCVIFLYWDLWAGKTTLSSILINNILQKSYKITSPTYVYYNKYDDIYHFDLYRIESYDEFISIGWEEILDNNNGIIFIEWPERIQEYYEADISIYIHKTDKEDERNISIIYKNKA